MNEDLESALRESSASAMIHSSRNTALMEKLKVHVDNLGYVIARDVPADGNCFFSSICHLLGRPVSDFEAAKFRRDFVIFLKSKVSISLIIS